MADVKPLKLADQGGGVGRLVEFETGDTLPKAALPALSAADVGAVAADDPRLSDAREWSAQTVDQAEAEAGTATTRRAWTAQRVRQAIVAWWNGVSSAWGRGFVASADAAAGRTALELGNAATATVQASSTDFTPGRLLSVGAGGLGSNAPIDEDWSQTASSVTGFRASSINGPTGSLVAYGLKVRAGSAVYVNFAGRSDQFFFQSNGSPWREAYHRGNLTPNVLASYTLATLPNAAANPRLQAWCSNLTGGAMPVYSDGTNWRRTFDNSIAN